EKVSLVDPELAKDPAGVYASMDFATRDRYRHVIERISRDARQTELEITRLAVQLAEQAQAAGADPAQAHIGYFLIDKGVTELERLAGYRPPLFNRMLRAIQRQGTPFYLISILILTLVIVTTLAWAMFQLNANAVVAIIGAILLLIPASDFAVNLV